MDLLPHITGDKLKGRLHFGYHPLSFIDPSETALAELFVLGHGANRFYLSADIGGDELAVSTHPAFQVDKVIGLTDGLNALFDLLALLDETFVLLASGVEGLLGLFKTHRDFWRTPWATLFGLLTRAFKTPLYLIKALPCLSECLVGGPFFGGQRGANGFAEFMLDMEQVGW